MTDTPAAAGTLVERLREYAADCDEGIVSDYETPGLLAREAADELAAATERIRRFDQTDSASCVGTGCKASSLAAQLSAVQLLREAADRTINRQYEQLSACRAELAKERGQATRMMNYWIYERFGNDSGSGADEELATWVDGLKAKAERAEESERLLAAVEKDAARLAEEWKRECSDADQILQALGLNPNSYRSEGGSLMLSKIVTALAGKESPK